MEIKNVTIEELSPNFYRQTLTFNSIRICPSNIYYFKTEDRTLMIDTTFNEEKYLKEITMFLEQQNIDVCSLDIFITHEHPDHTGLAGRLESMGATIYMNAEEDKEASDLLHCYLDDAKRRDYNFRLVGITPELAPDAYPVIKEYTEILHQNYLGSESFTFTPVEPGHIFTYGEYQLEVVALYGHTYGQCGLVERSRKWFFTGDQIMKYIAPIVENMQTDINLLELYMESLGTLKHRYVDFTMYPAHYEPVTDVKAEANRIIFSYLDKCDQMYQIVEAAEKPMTTRQIGVTAYGRSTHLPEFKSFQSCMQIWAKTFTCMEYLRLQEFVTRSEKDGTIYWEKRITG